MPNSTRRKALRPSAASPHSASTHHPISDLPSIEARGHQRDSKKTHQRTHHSCMHHPKHDRVQPKQTSLPSERPGDTDPLRLIPTKIRTAHGIIRNGRPTLFARGQSPTRKQPTGYYVAGTTVNCRPQPALRRTRSRHNRHKHHIRHPPYPSRAHR